MIDDKNFKNKSGRPKGTGHRKLKGKFLEKLKNFNTYKFNIGKICKEVGIDRTTYYSWLEQDGTFRKNVTITKEEFKDLLEEKLAERFLEKGDLKSGVTLLSVLAPERGYGKNKTGEKESLASLISKTMKK